MTKDTSFKYYVPAGMSLLDAKIKGVARHLDSAEDDQRESDDSKAPCPEGFPRGVQLMELIRKEVGNLTILQTGVLLKVFEEPGIAQSDLVHFFHTTEATISRTIKFFEKRYATNRKTGKNEYMGLGLLEQKVSADSGRARDIYPTEKGRALRDKIKQLL